MFQKLNIPKIEATQNKTKTRIFVCLKLNADEESFFSKKRALIKLKPSFLFILLLTVLPNRKK